MFLSEWTDYTGKYHHTKLHPGWIFPGVYEIVFESLSKAKKLNPVYNKSSRKLRPEKLLHGLLTIPVMVHCCLQSQISNIEHHKFHQTLSKNEHFKIVLIFSGKTAVKTGCGHRSWPRHGFCVGRSRCRHSWRINCR